MPYTIVERRAGDVASCYADPKLAAEGLKWKAVRGLSEMCKLTGSVDGMRFLLKVSTKLRSKIFRLCIDKNNVLTHFTPKPTNLLILLSACLGDNSASSP